MSTYDFPQLIKHWGMESITSEQAIGQILLHIQSLRERVNILEKLAPTVDQSDMVRADLIDDTTNDVGIEKVREEKKSDDAELEGQ